MSSLGAGPAGLDFQGPKPPSLASEPHSTRPECPRPSSQSHLTAPTTASTAFLRLRFVDSVMTTHMAYLSTRKWILHYSSFATCSPCCCVTLILVLICITYPGHQCGHSFRRQSRLYGKRPDHIGDSVTLRIDLHPAENLQ